jgi:outer membrane protein TolC
MNKKQLLIAAGCLSFFSLRGQNLFTVEEVIRKAQTQSPAFKQTETIRETKYWQYRVFRANYNPQIQLGNTGGQIYSKGINPVIQPTGTIAYQPVNQINPGAGLALQQPIQWTGGTIAVNSSYNFFKDYTNKVPDQWSGIPVNLSLYQPVFAFNPYKWNKRTEPIRYEESKRDYAENMEQISEDAVSFFFTVMEAQVNLQIAKFNLAYNDTIYKIEQGRYNIGTTSEDKLLQVELQLLRSRQDVATANLKLQTGSLNLRRYMGVSDSEPFGLVLPDTIPPLALNEDDAVTYARQTRSAFAAFERRKIEALEGVAQARGSLYQVGISAAYGLNNQSPTFSEIYSHPSRQQIANVTFTIPVLDWGRRKAQMHTARAVQKLADYQIAQDEVNFEQAIRTQVRQFELLYLQLEITKKSDAVALKRYVVSQNRYLIGKVDITNLNIALNEKDSAKRGYIQALRDFWTAYYELRRLTLYDWLDKKFLYNPHAED